MADEYVNDELYAANQIVEIIQTGSVDAARGFAETYKDLMSKA